MSGLNLDANKAYITELNPPDVLFGRGSGPNDHHGNIVFRQRVAERKTEYMSTNHRLTKAKIAREIVESVMNENGRFLKKLEPSDAESMGVPAGIDAWVEVDDDTIMEKAKQALRQNSNKPASSNASSSGKSNASVSSANRTGYDNSSDILGSTRGSSASLQATGLVNAKRNLGEQFNGQMNHQFPDNLTADDLEPLPVSITSSMLNKLQNVTPDQFGSYAKPFLSGRTASDATIQISNQFNNHGHHAHSVSQDMSSQQEILQQQNMLLQQQRQQLSHQQATSQLTRLQQEQELLQQQQQRLQQQQMYLRNLYNQNNQMNSGNKFAGNIANNDSQDNRFKQQSYDRHSLQRNPTSGQGEHHYSQSLQRESSDNNIGLCGNDEDDMVAYVPANLRQKMGPPAGRRNEALQHQHQHQQQQESTNMSLSDIPLDNLERRMSYNVNDLLKNGIKSGPSLNMDDLMDSFSKSKISINGDDHRKLLASTDTMGTIDQITTEDMSFATMNSSTFSFLRGNDSVFGGQDGHGEAGARLESNKQSVGSGANYGNYSFGNMSFVGNEGTAPRRSSDVSINIQELLASRRKSSSLNMNTNLPGVSEEGDTNDDLAPARMPPVLDTLDDSAYLEFDSMNASSIAMLKGMLVSNENIDLPSEGANNLSPQHLVQQNHQLQQQQNQNLSQNNNSNQEEYDSNDYLTQQTHGENDHSGRYTERNNNKN